MTTPMPNSWNRSSDSLQQFRENNCAASVRSIGFVQRVAAHSPSFSHWSIAQGFRSSTEKGGEGQRGNRGTVRIGWGELSARPARFTGICIIWVSLCISTLGKLPSRFFATFFMESRTGVYYKNGRRSVKREVGRNISDLVLYFR